MRGTDGGAVVQVVRFDGGAPWSDGLELACFSADQEVPQLSARRSSTRFNAASERRQEKESVTNGWMTLLLHHVQRVRWSNEGPRENETHRMA